MFVVPEFDSDITRISIWQVVEVIFKFSGYIYRPYFDCGFESKTVNAMDEVTKLFNRYCSVWEQDIRGSQVRY